MRRFLSGGSVAERVLAFEKSPTVFGLGGSSSPVGDGRERRIPITVQPPPPPTPPTTSLFSPSTPEAATTQLETSTWKQPSRDIQVGEKRMKADLESHHNVIWAIQYSRDRFMILVVGMWISRQCSVFAFDEKTK